MSAGVRAVVSLRELHRLWSGRSSDRRGSRFVKGRKLGRSRDTTDKNDGEANITCPQRALAPAINGPSALALFNRMRGKMQTRLTAGSASSGCTGHTPPGKAYATVSSKIRSIAARARATLQVVSVSILWRVESHATSDIFLQRTPARGRPSLPLGATCKNRCRRRRMTGPVNRSWRLP